MQYNRAYAEAQASSSINMITAQQYIENYAPQPTHICTNLHKQDSTHWTCGAKWHTVARDTQQQQPASRSTMHMPGMRQLLDLTWDVAS